MYIYTWGNNEKRKQYSGKQCEIVKTLARNSVVLRFQNGEMLVSSRYAIRKLKP